MLVTTQGTKIHIYKCSQCGKLFSAQVGRVTVSCCVDHGGGCCHCMETEISEQSLENILSIIKGNPTMR
jgi:hypothetical protein